MKRMWAGLILAAACCAGSLAACGGDDDDDNPSTQGSGGRAGTGGGNTGGSGTGGSGTGGSGTGGGGMTTGGDAQTPPRGADAVEAWLATGAYKQWDCEPEPHASRAPSPHGYNRICSNSAIAVNATGTGDWPVGSAAVKELFAAEGDTTPAGYAVYLKTKADSAGGDNWYWYERLPGKTDTVADGLGNDGPAKTICVSCHVAAGVDDEHLPTPGGRDQVYTPVAGVQTPPQGREAIEAWLAAGTYKQWAAEPAVHDSRSPSPHGYNRIFSNELIAANASGKGDWPLGSAAVKELFANATDDEPVGYAVYLKTKADSAGGDNWYWYERVPLDNAAPHDENGVVADGFGDQGGSRDVCVSCHVAAGIDDEHLPTPGGRDQVYTPVP